MPMIEGIQQRKPYSHSTLAHSHYSQSVSCDEFVVKKQSYGENVNVNLFFPSSYAPKQGVGLSFPSPEVAIAVGRALLTVAEGCASEIRGRFS